MIGEHGKWSALVVAVGLHVALFPLWLVQSVFPLADATSGGHPSSIAYTMFGLTLCVVGLGGWCWLTVKLVQWWRQGRTGLWPYPLMWAALLIFSVLSASAWLLPGVRRAMMPPASDL